MKPSPVIERSKWSGITALVVVALVLAGCGGSDPDTSSDDVVDVDNGEADNGSGAGGSGTEADLEQAATDMFLAYTSGDHQTYFNFLSRQCRESLEFAAVDSHLDGRRFRSSQAGIEIRTLGVAGVDISNFSGDSAFVALNLSGTTETFEESIPAAWVYEENGWHKDECSNITPAQGGLEGYGTDRNEPIPYGGVADINGWLMTVSFIQPDAEDLVVELGGEPAAEGNQLFNIQLNPSYNGANATTILGEDLAFAMVNESTVYGAEADCASADPAFLDMGIQASPGDDIGLPFLCREVAAEHAEGMLLRVTDLSTGTEYWFDLAQP